MRCKSCALLLLKAYPGQEWSSVVARAKASDTFRQGVVQAKAVMSGQAKASFPPAVYSDVATMGYVMERPLWFATPSEFEGYFKVKHTQLGLPLDELEDECGRPLKGIVLSNPNEPFRRLTLQNYVQTHLAKKLLEPGALFREEQACEFKSMCDGEKIKKRPRSMTSPPSVPELKEMAEKLRSEPKENPESAKAPGQAAPLAGTGQVPVKMEDDEDDEDDVPEEDPELKDPQLAAPWLSTTTVQKKGKGKGKEKEKEKGSAKRLAVDFVGKPPKKVKATSCAAASAAGASEDGSICGLRLGKCSAASVSERASQSGQAKLEQLDVEKALLGGKVKGDVYHASRALEALTAAQPGTSEEVCLRARIDLVQKCATIGGQKIYTVETKMRQKLVEEVCARCETLPPQFEASLVVCAVKDFIATPGELLVDEWMRMVSPFSPASLDLSSGQTRKPPGPCKALPEEHVLKAGIPPGKLAQEARISRASHIGLV